MMHNTRPDRLIGASSNAPKQFILVLPGLALQHRHNTNYEINRQNLTQDLDPQENPGPVGEYPEQQEIPPTVREDQRYQ